MSEYKRAHWKRIGPVVEVDWRSLFVDSIQRQFGREINWRIFNFELEKECTARPADVVRLSASAARDFAAELTEIADDLDSDEAAEGVEGLARRLVDGFARRSDGQ
ncbi:hypothetical protein QN239_19235 [Mycolicibacterium sp. Y3]